MQKPKNIDEYISSFPKETQKLLQQIRSVIKAAAPEAEEVISYSMPAFRQKGILVWFAGYSKHIGFYPTASGIAGFKKELSAYKTSKGAVQFPLDKALPANLISKMVTFRAKEDLKKSKEKKK
jgi:uncharacterized protein YdhG (YjbR/CyaY superfamily)